MNKTTRLLSLPLFSLSLPSPPPPFPQQSLGFSSDDQVNIQKLLAAILHLGNVKLEDAGDGESSKVGSMAELEKVARLLGTSKSELVKALTMRVVAAKTEVVEAKQNQARATYARDALAKVGRQLRVVESKHVAI